MALFFKMQAHAKPRNNESNFLWVSKGRSRILTNESMLLFALDITVWDGHEVFSSVPRLTGWFFQRLVYGGVLPPPHSLRQAQGCGFPHTQVAKRTAPSLQSQPKRPHDHPDIANYFTLSVVTESLSFRAGPVGFPGGNPIQQAG